MMDSQAPANTKPRHVNILIDWDNVHHLWKKRGIQHVVNESLRIANLASYAGLSRIKVRLYGGWFLGQSVSRRAQDLSVQIQKFYPSNETGAGSSRTIVDVELAKTLVQDPKAVFTHTFREREFVGNMSCDLSAVAGCVRPLGCPISNFASILKGRQCTDSACPVTLDSILMRSEQKLVDTMFALDVVYYSRFPSRDIVVVTGDDDLLPAIHSALLNGARIVHIHPSPGMTTPSHYARLMSTSYRSVSFEMRT